MKGLLFLSLVGAAIYTALVVTHDFLPSDRAADTFTSQRPTDPGVRQLRSWGSDLPALASSQASLLPLHKPAVVVAGPNESDPSEYSKSAVRSEEKSTSSQVEGTAYEPIARTKVILAARVHSEASVSSPTIRFYQPGIALQVVSRENGWLQVADPASQERGWVLEKYLASIEGPTLTQTAMDATPRSALSEQVTVKPAFTGAKKRNRSAKRAPRGSNDVAFAEFNSRNDRWSRRADRRGGLGLFFFGRFARAEADAR
jgi:Bacterial SH3 domain